MKLAFITPTAYLRKFATQGDIYLALAHLIDDDGKNEYASFHRFESAKGRQVILDNGLFEGAQVPTDILLRRAKSIQADIICAPDLLYDAQGTIKLFKEFIKAKQDSGFVSRVMGIPQADNPSDWWDCYRFMELSSDCDIIGLSILSVPKSFKAYLRSEEQSSPITSSRVRLLRELVAYRSILGRNPKPIHLLGLGESYADIITAKRWMPDVVVSNDSSSAFVHGMEGVSYSRLGTWKGGKIRKKLDFNIKDLEAHQIYDIQYNITIAKKIGKMNLAT